MTSVPPTKNQRKKRTFDARNTASKKCDTCGGPGGCNECRSCNKIYCDSCDEMYHRHPLRQTHIREKVRFNFIESFLLHSIRWFQYNLFSLKSDGLYSRSLLIFRATRLLTQANSVSCRHLLVRDIPFDHSNLNY